MDTDKLDALAFLDLPLLELYAEDPEFNVDASINSDDQTALLIAASTGNHAAVSFLLAHGANPRHTDALGNTALHNAARAGSRDVLQALVRAGANPQRPNASGLSPIDVAIDAGVSDAVAYLFSDDCADDAKLAVSQKVAQAKGRPPTPPAPPPKDLLAGIGDRDLPPPNSALKPDQERSLRAVHASVPALKPFWYVCDGYDDDGWGCGYRCIQMLLWQVHTQLKGNDNPSIPTVPELCDQMAGDLGIDEAAPGKWADADWIIKYMDNLIDLDHVYHFYHNRRSAFDLVNKLHAHFQRSPLMAVVIGGGIICCIGGVRHVSQSPAGAAPAPVEGNGGEEEHVDADAEKDQDEEDDGMTISVAGVSSSTGASSNMESSKASANSGANKDDDEQHIVCTDMQDVGNVVQLFVADPHGPPDQWTRQGVQLRHQSSAEGSTDNDNQQQTDQAALLTLMQAGKGGVGWIDLNEFFLGAVDEEMRTFLLDDDSVLQNMSWTVVMFSEKAKGGDGEGEDGEGTQGEQ